MLKEQHEQELRMSAAHYSRQLKAVELQIERENNMTIKEIIVKAVTFGGALAGLFVAGPVGVMAATAATDR